MSSLIQNSTKFLFSIIVAVSAMASYGTASAQVELSGKSELSIRNEVQQSIDRGLEWLEKNQNTNGTWSTGDQPSLTALALLAFEGNAQKEEQRGGPPFLQKRICVFGKVCST